MRYIEKPDININDDESGNEKIFILSANEFQNADNVSSSSSVEISDDSSIDFEFSAINSKRRNATVSIPMTMMGAERFFCYLF